MTRSTIRGRTKVVMATIAALALASAAAIRTALGSDHQDTPEVELSPRMDINDVYAFPGTSSQRMVLAMTTSSPITPAQSSSARFDPNLLYQFKIDNDGDAVEDFVIQATFRGTGPDQQVDVRGPVAPAMTGMLTSVVDVSAAVSGAINQNLGSPAGIQVFAGLRDDPFFLDLEQFFCIIPDRRPVTGALSGSCTTGVSGSFRPAGQAVDYLSGFNALAIVVELPTATLTAGGTSRLGIWGTISR